MASSLSLAYTSYCSNYLRPMPKLVQLGGNNYLDSKGISASRFGVAQRKLS